MKRPDPRTVVAPALILAALALAACGDDESAAPASATTETPATTESTATTSTTSTDSTTTETTSTATTTTTDEGGSGGVTPGSGSASTAQCPGAESPPNIINVTSFGADCGAVEGAMAEIKSVRRSFRIGDFDCQRASGSRYGGTWECRGEAAYFSFDFAD